MSTRSAKRQIDELMAEVGAKTKTDLARVLGITSPAIHIAISKGKVPQRWIERIKERGKQPVAARPSNGKAAGAQRKATVPAQKAPTSFGAWSNGGRAGEHTKDALRNIGRGLQQMGRGIEQLAEALSGR